MGRAICCFRDDFSMGIQNQNEHISKHSDCAHWQCGCKETTADEENNKTYDNASIKTRNKK